MQERILTKPDEMEWVTIPAGEFIMGRMQRRITASRRLTPNFPMSGLHASSHSEKYTSPNTPLQNTQ